MVLGELFPIDGSLSALVRLRLREAAGGELETLPADRLREEARRARFVQILADALVLEQARVPLGRLLPGLGTLVPARASQWQLSGRLCRSLARHDAIERDVLLGLSLEQIGLWPRVAGEQQRELAAKAIDALIVGALVAGPRQARKAVDSERCDQARPSGRS